MIPYRHRFHGHAGLKYVYKNARVVRGSLFTLKYLSNPRRSTSRFAVVVSKKVLKSAVGRNRIRRRVYELFRANIEHLPHNVDIVCIITSPEVCTMSADDLTQEFLQRLHETGLYKTPH